LYFTRILDNDEEEGFGVGRVGGKTAGAAGATELVAMEEGIVEIEEGGEMEMALVPILRW
jgi:hypothetical protein